MREEMVGHENVELLEKVAWGGRWELSDKTGKSMEGRGVVAHAGNSSIW